MLIPSFLLIGDGCPDEQIRNISSERNFTYSFIQTSSIDELSKFLNIINQYLNIPLPCRAHPLLERNSFGGIKLSYIVYAFL